VKSTGRRALIVAMCPEGRPVIDVGADHGHVARALGAIATEREARRIGRRDVRWVVADGLRPFRHVPVAVITGMGALTIAKILEAGPRPDALVAHAPDDPGTLRRWLAGHGWRIDAEGLAREGPRFAEVIRAVPGEESATDLALEFGPRLLERGHPLLRPHLERTARFWRAIATATATAAPGKHAEAARRVAVLERVLAASPT
jgi:tRNA (adenine22-N1)-methyltransferase